MLRFNSAVIRFTAVIDGKSVDIQIIADCTSTLQDVCDLLTDAHIFDEVL